MNNIYFPNHYRIIRNKEAGKRANNRETVYPKFRKSTRHRSGRSNRRKKSTSPGKEAGVLEWVCDFILRVWTQCCSQRIFAVHKTNLQISGKSYRSQLLKTVPVLCRYNCRRKRNCLYLQNSSVGSGKPIAETHGENGGWFRSPFLLPTKKGHSCPHVFPHIFTD